MTSNEQWRPFYEVAGDLPPGQREEYMRGQFVGPTDYRSMAAGAASGYALGWGLKQIWRGLFGSR